MWVFFCFFFEFSSICHSCFDLVFMIVIYIYISICLCFCRKTGSENLRLRDCWHTNNFWRTKKILSIKQPPPPPPHHPPVFLMDNVKMDTLSIKIKWKIHVLFPSLWKFVRYSHHIFYFLLFLLAFTRYFSHIQLVYTNFLLIHSPWPWSSKTSPWSSEGLTESPG